MGAKGSPPRAPKVGPTRAHLGGAHQAYISKGGTIPLTLASFAGRRPLFHASSPSCSRGSSNPECDASSRMCGLRGGAALATQGRAVREVVHATALSASIQSLQNRPVRSNRRPSVAVYRISLTGNRWKPVEFKSKFKSTCVTGIPTGLTGLPVRSDRLPVF